MIFQLVPDFSNIITSINLIWKIKLIWLDQIQCNTKKAKKKGTKILKEHIEIELHGTRDRVKLLLLLLLLLLQKKKSFTGNIIIAYGFTDNIEYWVKMARMVKLKLAFMEWFFIYLVILIKLYKIRYLNLDKALLFPRNLAICLKNWKLWRAPTTTKFSIFCWNFAHLSYLTISAKGCSGFLFCLEFELFIKM